MEVVVMPKLGLTMEEGTVTRWIKKEGEKVIKGEVLFEVETDKALNEIEATISGTVGKILVDEGETAEVSQAIAYILEIGEEPPDEWPNESAQLVWEGPRVSTVDAEVKISPVAARIAQEQGIDFQLIVGTGESGQITKQDVLEYIAEIHVEDKATRIPRKASPRALRLAEEKGLPLELVRGSGPRGRITERDVIHFIESQNLIRPSRIQQIAGERLTQSFTSIPHFYLKIHVGAGELSRWRKKLLSELENKTGLHPTYTDLILFLVARTLKNHPRLNASWEDGFIRLYDEVNIGLAVAVEDGLIVPVIRNADRKPIEDIVLNRAYLVEKAQKGKLGLADIEGGTFTITNLGMFGIDEFAPIINPPQSAILSIGSIEDRVCAEAGEVIIEPTAIFTLAIDHRVLDGAVGAEFLQELKLTIEQPDDVFNMTS